MGERWKIKNVKHEITKKKVLKTSGEKGQTHVSRQGNSDLGGERHTHSTTLGVQVPTGGLRLQGEWGEVGVTLGRGRGI